MKEAPKRAVFFTMITLGETRGCQFILFMQITTFCTYKTKPNLQVKAKKTVCITSKLALFSIFFFDVALFQFVLSATFKLLQLQSCTCPGCKTRTKP